MEPVLRRVGYLMNYVDNSVSERSEMDAVINHGTLKYFRDIISDESRKSWVDGYNTSIKDVSPCPYGLASGQLSKGLAQLYFIHDSLHEKEKFSQQKAEQFTMQFPPEQQKGIMDRIESGSGKRPGVATVLAEYIGRDPSMLSTFQQLHHSSRMNQV